MCKIEMVEGFTFDYISRSQFKNFCLCDSAFISFVSPPTPPPFTVSPRDLRW